MTNSSGESEFSLILKNFAFQALRPLYHPLLKLAQQLFSNQWSSEGKQMQKEISRVNFLIDDMCIDGVFVCNRGDPDGQSFKVKHKEVSF